MITADAILKLLNDLHDAAPDAVHDLVEYRKDWRPPADPANPAPPDAWWKLFGRGGPVQSLGLVEILDAVVAMDPDAAGRRLAAVFAADQAGKVIGFTLIPWPPAAPTPAPDAPPADPAAAPTGGPANG